MRKVWLLILLLMLPPALYANNYDETTGWIKSSELMDLLNQKSQDRYFPSHVYGQVQAHQIVYKATFSPFLKNMQYFYSYWGMTDEVFKTRNDYFNEHGFQRFSDSSFIDLSGSTIHQATWVLMTQEPNKQEPGTMDKLLKFFSSMKLI